MNNSKNSINVSKKNKKYLDNKKIENEKNSRDMRTRKSIDCVFATSEGKEVLKYLHDSCGYSKESIVWRDNKIDTELTLYNETRRLVYIQLRQYIDPEILKDVEFRK